MDPKKIFNLFGPFKNNELKISSKEELDNYIETPHFKLGMFKKLILNEESFIQNVTKFFVKTDPKLDKTDLERAGEYLAYTRAWYWIKDCDIDSDVWGVALQDYKDDNLLITIRLCIKYFENIEEYEKCAFLKKIQSFIERSLDT
jgi:hypothetical protein